jgi:dTDP-glucose 4,6-dehydratase
LLSDEALPVNVGNPREMTIGEFANIIAELTGSTAGVIYHPLPEDDPKQRRPDITKARRLLKWEPVVPLEVGLRRTVEYFRGLPEMASL